MLDYFLPMPSLQTPPGPFRVGTSVYEIPTTDIPSTSPVPDPDITTFRFRLYYPTTFDAKSTTPVPWLPQPQNEWTRAYLEFSGASGFLSHVVSSFTTLLKYTTIPAVNNSPVLPRDHLLPVVLF